jgi:parallel beta-helix repeat protein
MLLGTSFSTGIFINKFQTIPLKSSFNGTNKKSFYPPEEEWNRTFGGKTHDSAYSVLQTSDGGFIILGYTQSFGDGGDVWLIKTDSKGIEEWNKTFDGIGMFDGGRDILRTSDDGYIIAGFTSNMVGPPKDFYADAWLIKLDSNFNEQWNKTFALDDFDTFNSIQQIDDGYIILGETFNETSKNRIWLVKTDENGNEQWNKTYGENENAFGESLILTSDGGFIIIGTKKTGPYNLDFWLLKFDKNGNMLWNKTYGGSNWDWGLSILEANDSGYFLLGRLGPFKENDDLWLIKTNENGYEQWNKTFGGKGNDGGESIISIINGNYLIIGSTSSFGAGNSDLWMIKIDGNGSEYWNKTIGGKDDDWGRSIIQTIDGEYIIGGVTYSFGAGFGDAWLIKLSHDIPPRKVYIDDDYDENTSGWGYNHFNKIQEGIDAVNENGTVIVYSGTYYENLIIDKTINLIGENKDTTNIVGLGIIKSVVYISADFVKMSGFQINYSGYIPIPGIYILSNYTTITCNYISYSQWSGIFITGNNNTINNNLIDYNPDKGLYITGAYNNIINNNISNNSYGILLVGPSSNNILSCNKIIFNNRTAIALNKSNNNTIYDNVITSNYGYGILLNESSNNIISSNKILKNSYGIKLLKSNKQTISFNNIFDNWGGGIESKHSSYNIIEYNSIEENDYGIGFRFDLHCIIQKNNFIRNQDHIFFFGTLGTNSYDSNYWDNWIGVKFKLPFFQRIPKLVHSGIIGFQFDWHPAKKPYEI